MRGERGGGGGGGILYVVVVVDDGFWPLSLVSLFLSVVLIFGEVW